MSKQVREDYSGWFCDDVSCDIQKVGCCLPYFPGLPSRTHTVQNHYQH